tara:strand:+ start:7424 stop:8470 length:1047 start_codon:yes stop_codon:yes gene_type:complete
MKTRIEFTINKKSRSPKYLQIADAIIHNISVGSLKMDEQMPSVSGFSKEYKVSRDTVSKAYNFLKEKKIITAHIGKGTYINSTKLISKVNILFLINKLSTYKLKMYNSFIKSIGEKYHTDFEIYHCDESLFLSLMEKNINKYDYYIIMPHFKTKQDQQIIFSNESMNLIKSIPREKLIIMDNNDLNIDGDIIEIYQDFESDIFNALRVGLTKIKKYKKLTLVVPENTNYPYLIKILNGFKRFCTEHSFDFEILNKVSDHIAISRGDLFVTIEDDDLVMLVDLIAAKNYTLGKDVGMISYNETPLKRLLGIAVVSTNFELMGETAASMIHKNQKGKIKNPFNFIDRKSI